MNNLNNGYKGYSMSNRAYEAYESGEKPMSQWTKQEILEEIEAIYNQNDFKLKFEEIKKIPSNVLKELCLVYSSWHHTSSYCNSTSFYSLDFEKVQNLTLKSVEECQRHFAQIKKEKKEKEEKEEKNTYMCDFLEWSGTRNHPYAKHCRAIGKIVGNWFYIENYGKKSINANGFSICKKLTDEEIKLLRRFDNYINKIKKEEKEENVLILTKKAHKLNKKLEKMMIFNLGKKEKLKSALFNFYKDKEKVKNILKEIQK